MYSNSKVENINYHSNVKITKSKRDGKLYNTQTPIQTNYER